MAGGVFPRPFSHMAPGSIKDKEQAELGSPECELSSSRRETPTSVQGTARAKGHETFLAVPPRLEDICAQPQATISSVTHLSSYLAWDQLDCRAENLSWAGFWPSP